MPAELIEDFGSDLARRSDFSDLLRRLQHNPIGGQILFGKRRAGGKVRIVAFLPFLPASTPTRIISTHHSFIL